MNSLAGDFSERGRMTAASAPPARHADQPVFDHLERLTDNRGLFEHALGTVPRREHGYCVDDAARGLIVMCREPDPAASTLRLARGYLSFVLASLEPAWTCHNRMDADGNWCDEAATGDWWGGPVGPRRRGRDSADDGHAGPGPGRIPHCGPGPVPAPPVDGLRGSGSR